MKAKQLAGELIEVEAVETFWRTKLKALRARILSIADSMHTLPCKGADHAGARAAGGS